MLLSLIHIKTKILEKEFNKLVKKEIKKTTRRKKIVEQKNKNVVTVILLKDWCYHRLDFYQNKKYLYSYLIDSKDNEKNINYTLHIAYRQFLLSDKYLLFQNFEKSFRQNKEEIPKTISETSLSGKKYIMYISSDKITCTIFCENNKKKYEGYLFHGGISVFNRLIDRDTWL